MNTQRYAFRQLRSGVPRPVHIDFPSEVYRAQFKTAGDLAYFFDKSKYRSESKPHPSPTDLRAAIDLLKAAQRPIIVSSNGVFYSRAWDALKKLAEKTQHSRSRIRRNEGAILRRASTLGERSSWCTRQRRCGCSRRPVLHADNWRVRFWS